MYFFLLWPSFEKKSKFPLGVTSSKKVSLQIPAVDNDKYIYQLRNKQPGDIKANRIEEFEHLQSEDKKTECCICKREIENFKKETRSEMDRTRSELDRNRSEMEELRNVGVFFMFEHLNLNERYCNFKSFYKFIYIQLST